MSTRDPIDEAYEEMLREHTKLHSLLENLARTLSERSSAMTDVSSGLTELQALIGDHFRTEEDSGCFSNMISHAPRVSERVEVLIAEHGSMYIEIRELVARASDCQGSHDDWDEIGVRFRKFRGRLMKHESVENELLQEVFTEDIGSKD